eukprot:3827038-Amphidinium_carterae.1
MLPPAIRFALSPSERRDDCSWILLSIFLAMPGAAVCSQSIIVVVCSIESTSTLVLRKHSFRATFDLRKHHTVLAPCQKWRFVVRARLLCNLHDAVDANVHSSEVSVDASACCLNVSQAELV